MANQRSFTKLRRAGIGGSVNNVAEVRTMQRQGLKSAPFGKPESAFCWLRPLHVAQIPQTPFEQRITDLLHGPLNTGACQLCPK